MSTRMTTSPTGVPWHVTAAAIAVPLCVFPSAAWRFSHVVDVVVNGPGPCHTGGNAETVYVAGLSFVSFGLALLTLGLVRPWGEMLPRWVPVVGGRPVHARAVTAAAAALATLVAAAVVFYFVKDHIGLAGPRRPLPPGCTAPDLDILVYYVPLIAWPPLLYYVTFRYHRRRTGVRKG
jgi:hypothetical protein